MKYFKLFIIFVLLITNYIIGYSIGKATTPNPSKDYQAACILNTCCLNMIDNLGVDAEEIYYEYVSNLDCFKDITLTSEGIEHYHWNF